MLTLRDRLATFATDGRGAYKIADALVDGIIAALRRDPRFSAHSTFEIELVLADARTDVARRLVRELRDRVHVADIDDGECL